MLVLQVIQGPDRGMKFSLPADEPQLIGRSSEALPITDSTVSRRHAELTPDDGHWYINDLESSNGTFLNGQQLAQRTALSPGDQIRCGSTLFLFMPQPEARSSAIELLPPETLDVTIEHTVDAGDESALTSFDPPQPPHHHHATDHLRVIYELTALTASVVDRDELLNKAMDLIFEQFRPDRGFILLQERPEDPSLPVVVRYRQKPKNVDEGRIPVSRTIISHTLEKREGILATNAMTDERFRSGDSVRDYGIRSAICVPVISGPRVFGVIHIDSSMANVTFNESQLRLMNAIGQHTGLALLGVEQLQVIMQNERLATMGQTVASLSHSIKNILQGLRGGADAIELALNRDDLSLAREGWPIVTRNLDRIFALTLNMLTYSKPAQLDIELTSLPPLIQEVTDLLTPQCQRKKISVFTDLDEDMPPIPADPNALHQALMNLLTNALEAVPRRDGVITVRTAYGAKEHEARIQVSDNGPGIAANLHDSIFEAFSSTKGQRGTGLGLAVTRKIVEEHGGRVELESAPGEGATFSIVLPSDLDASSAGDTKLPRPMPVEDF